MVCGHVKCIFLEVNGVKHAKPCFSLLMYCKELLEMSEMSETSYISKTFSEPHWAGFLHCSSGFSLLLNHDLDQRPLHPK